MPSKTKLILEARLCPGDEMARTAAVESLHLQYPDEFETDIRTNHPAIWENNPRVTAVADGDGQLIAMEYPAIHTSNQRAESFLNGYVRDLGRKLDRPLELRTNRPHVYLSDDEETWVSQIEQHHTDGKRVPFWIVNAGVKSDFTNKQWPPESYQRVVDATIGRIQWVQVGNGGRHPKLNGVIDLIGQTDTRQLLRLCFHACGGLGPVTFLQHVMAAFRKPYLCLNGGREPVNWVSYPHQHTFHTIGQLECCRDGGCWKSRTVKLGDNDDKDNSLCEFPILGGVEAFPKCMGLISPESVISTLERLLCTMS